MMRKRMMNWMIIISTIMSNMGTKCGWTRRTFGKMQDVTLRQQSKNSYVCIFLYFYNAIMNEYSNLITGI